MDYATARRFLIDQSQSDSPDPDVLLTHLRQGRPPVPGQITSILLALKIVFESLRGKPTLDRELASALHWLAWESRRCYEQKVNVGVTWPPLLDEDLERIALAVQRIFADQAGQDEAAGQQWLLGKTPNEQNSALN